jgi:hypothetical protein
MATQGSACGILGALRGLEPRTTVLATSEAEGGDLVLWASKRLICCLSLVLMCPSFLVATRSSSEGQKSNVLDEIHNWLQGFGKVTSKKRLV